MDEICLLEKENLFKKYLENNHSKRIMIIGKLFHSRRDFVNGLFGHPLGYYQSCTKRNYSVEICGIDEIKFQIKLDDEKQEDFDSIDKLRNYIRENVSKCKNIMKIYLSKSEYPILDDLIFFDTPFYDQSEEIDNQIINSCDETTTIVFVTSMVGSIGFQDESFIKSLAKKIFLLKIIFVFTQMEQVAQNERCRVKNFHIKDSKDLSSKCLFIENKSDDKYILFIDNISTFSSEFNEMLPMPNMFEHHKEEIRNILEKLKIEHKRTRNENETESLDKKENENDSGKPEQERTRNENETESLDKKEENENESGKPEQERTRNENETESLDKKEENENDSGKPEQERTRNENETESLDKKKTTNENETGSPGKS